MGDDSHKDEILPALQSDWNRIGHISIEMPAPTLLNIHNSLPYGHQGRQVILNHIKKAAEKNVKAHWIRALVVDETGNLAFDPILYDQAVARGKQETYFASAMEVFDKLQFALSQISNFQISEQNASRALQDGVERKTLVSLPDQSAGVEALKKHIEALGQMAEQMKDGLPNLLQSQEQNDHR